MQQGRTHNEGRHWAVQCAALIVCVAQLGCGGATATDAGGSDASPTASADDSAGGAVAALFGPSQSASLARLKRVRTVKDTEQGPGMTTCEEALSSTPTEGRQITIGAYGAAGKYGSDQAGVTVAASDFCALPETPTTLNTAVGFDGNGLVATFVLEGDVNAGCSDSTTIVMRAGSAGIWRNTTDYSPQVWGTFDFLVNGEPLTLHCTFYLGSNETIQYADCSNESGTVVDQDSSASCQIVSE